MEGTAAVGIDLRAAFNKADSKVKRLESALAAARDERDELATTMRVLIKHGYMPDDADLPVVTPKTGDMNERQLLVYSSVPIGEQRAIAPKLITEALHADGYVEITADYVRTTLWRLGQRNTLQVRNGLYWREPDEAEKVEAPGAETPRASEELGPVTGRERGYPPSTPEGSIPSGSTPSRPLVLQEDHDLDDDVPF